jgi:formylglycine-generating enzyme required for sulfatase activity
MPRLFISHSSKDNVAAVAFKQWLGANGWPEEDVFLDLDDIGGGERWKEALRKANLQCEAIILLASPEALSSPECLAEVRKAEDYGKEIVVVLLRDVQLDDHRLDAFKDRQIVNFAMPPQSHVESVSYRGDQFQVAFNGEALARVKAYLLKRGIASEHFTWPPPNKPDAEPFPGLTAFTEEEAGIFFGRDVDIVRGLDKLRIMRRNGRPRALVIQASSGAGKSSYMRAGLWARLDRDPDFAAVAVLRPAKGILKGSDGLGRKLAERLSRPDRPINPGDIHAQLLAPDEKQAVSDFKKLIAMVAAQACEQRRIGDKNAAAPALLLAIDQAEELFASGDEAESQRFLFLIANLLADPPAGLELYMLLTIRADASTRLLQKLTELGLEFPESLPLLPLPRTSYGDVILRPLEVLAKRGQRLVITPELKERLIADATGADALPLLAFTLHQLYREFSAGGTITFKQYDAMGGVTGVIESALKLALAEPGNDPAIPASKTEQLAHLRAAFIPWLARIDPESGLPMRRVARADELPAGSLPIVERLVEARLLVADRRADVNIVEIAHESLLRQWPALTEWLKADAENLKLIESVERAAGEWERRGRNDEWLVHRGARLRAAESLALREDFRKRLGELGLAYLEACRENEQKRKAKLSALIGAFMVLLILGGVARLYERQLREGFYWLTQVRNHVLTAAGERALKPGDPPFKECTDCPEMMVVPAGNFEMGSPKGQGDKTGREYPQHPVTIPSRFAVGKYEVTFAEFDACAAHGDCDAQISSKWGRDRQPVINVTWGDAKRYAAWLARITGKPYRLLTEAEYEYAARGREQKAYPWGDAAGIGNANCGECSREPPDGTAQVASFPANRFGLHNMVGNVAEWVEDCFHSNYEGAPKNGSAWLSDKCLRRVVRGGSWQLRASAIRSASRDWQNAGQRTDKVGFRVARELLPQSNGAPNG